MEQHLGTPELSRPPAIPPKIRTMLSAEAPPQANDGPKHVRKWTNPWESPRPKLASETNASEINPSQSIGGRAGWTNPWESFDGNLLSPLSPLKSARDDNQARDWTNPWEVLCKRGPYVCVA